MNAYAFAVLSTHAKIHRELSTLDQRYRKLLEGIERREILAYNDDVTFARLEAMKRELLSIRFIEKGATDPSP